MVVTAHDALRSRGHTRPTLPQPHPSDLAAATAALQSACAAFAAELQSCPTNGARVDAAREALQTCATALDAGDEVDVEAVKVGRSAAPL
jgi:hypothetical protein